MGLKPEMLQNSLGKADVAQDVGKGGFCSDGPQPPGQNRGLNNLNRVLGPIIV